MLDRLGAFVAGACAVHCAALPLLMTATSGVGLALLSWHHPWHGAAMWLVRLSAWEAWFAVATLTLAAIALAQGYCRHRSRAPGAWALSAAVLFFAAIGSPLAADPLFHAGFAVAAGACLVCAHRSNRRRMASVVARA